MKEIFEMQKQLNTFILRKKCSVAFEYIPASEHNLTIWIQNYSKALFSETCEVVEAIQSDSGNTDHIREELIDMLHFIASLFLLTGLEPPDYKFNNWNNGNNVKAMWKHCNGVFLSLNDIQNAMSWKWWSKEKIFDLSAIKIALIRLYYHWMFVCSYFQMNIEDIKSIYKKKNQVNYARIINGYDVNNKEKDIGLQN